MVQGKPCYILVGIQVTVEQPTTVPARTGQHPGRVVMHGGGLSSPECSPRAVLLNLRTHPPYGGESVISKGGSEPYGKLRNSLI